MKNLIIHIGYHKSASTFLQNKVFPKLEANYLFFAGKNREILDYIQKAEEVDKSYINKWINNELKKLKKKCPVTILSHEELSGTPDGNTIIDNDKIANNLKAMFPNAKILIIIRNQMSYLTSIYTYRVAVKGFETRSFEKFLMDVQNTTLVEKLNYDKLIEKYIDLFGRENIFIIPMELLKIDSNKFLDKIVKFINVPNIELKNEKVNKSTKILIILNIFKFLNVLFKMLLNMLILFFNKKEHHYPFPKFRAAFYTSKVKINDLLYKLFKNGKKVNIEHCKKYSEYYTLFAESNRRLKNIANIDIDKYDYPI